MMAPVWRAHHGILGLPIGGAGSLRRFPCGRQTARDLADRLRDHLTTARALWVLLDAARGTRALGRR
jgi:hypothetical protein